ncbi:lipopolysaccharide transport periplasmic protein LptA [Acinetobacter sp. S40]|uniref:lipopolysaccharide transport periplasmic protein LptA n=1 Tax=unclassified Acinetobacter TaxID=196816 RepID=UPI00190C5BC0|nr:MULTISPECIES: lipopolysaccharide transport periplasmic protein LptA [unclassified Acinetobacter]MBJ9986807.1 lipopolysaccharide transport periplasmic protein LptA [Acinetobacter sp. S40]MBK0065124.1 lipopolysaccharide transport periplasmic protein LptA [Acinetobacter sp. S55]MBK0068339.1 lipopolysaccharide transport periplasmic protein LptA [Acinetobacter sp. S54]
MHQILNSTSRSTFLKQIAGFTVMAMLSVSAFALPADRNQPISLVADKATFNDRTGVTTYTGNVVIEQGTMKLQADSIVAQLNSKREIQTITANGRPSKFQQQISAEKGVARGEAQKIVYNADSGIITLTGNAYLFQDGASIRGNSLKYSMNKGDIEAQGSSSNRVQLIIPPSSSKSFPGARD